MHKFKILVAVLLIAALSACAGSGYGSNKRTGGTIVGAGLGALTGSQIGGGRGKLAAVAVGAIVGAFLGGEVGKSLDRADRLAMAETRQHALEKKPIGQSSTWNNPDTGHSGTVTPTRTYQEPSGQYCREFQHTVFIDGKTKRAYGTACRQPDGSWKLMPS